MDLQAKSICLLHFKRKYFSYHTCNQNPPYAVSYLGGHEKLVTFGIKSLVLVKFVHEEFDTFGTPVLVLQLSFSMLVFMFKYL